MHGELLADVEAVVRVLHEGDGARLLSAKLHRLCCYDVDGNTKCKQSQRHELAVLELCAPGDRLAFQPSQLRGRKAEKAEAVPHHQAIAAEAGPA